MQARLPDVSASPSSFIKEDDRPMPLLLPFRRHTLQIPFMYRIFTRRVLSAALLILLAVPFLSGGTAGFAKAAPVHIQQYEAAKREMDRLEKDARRSAWREPWEKLAKTFLDLYENNVRWVNRPAALPAAQGQPGGPGSL